MRTGLPEDTSTLQMQGSPTVEVVNKFYSLRILGGCPDDEGER